MADDDGARDQNVKVLDPGSLKALAHPLRVELFRALGEGPATATQLAARFGETSGATSYHLRQLARYGFIEEDPDRGTGRERWWRAAVRGTRLETHTALDDPASQEAARWFVRDAARRQFAELEGYLQHIEQVDREWIDSTTISDWQGDLTHEQLAALRDELHAVVERHLIDRGENPDPSARRVRINVHAFPKHLPPATDGPEPDA